jgi:hypothetical protein
MPKSFWMVVKSPTNYEIAKKRNFDMVGLMAQHRRKVQRMAPGDRVLLYISQDRYFATSASVTKALVIDHSPLWNVEGGSVFPYRVGIQPDVVLQPSQYIDAYQIAPRMDFTRRWTPELWFLAFQGSLHLISKFDFNMVEEEMKKQKRTRMNRHDAKPRREPPRESNCKLDDRGHLSRPLSRVGW